ncbi:MAG TPA: Na+/H+ antiporter NhaA [Gemmatimonadaceae bacterium]|nr:Na+/H+ antiporter NhaA [Gemmatimonadaceae bacterium]
MATARSDRLTVPVDATRDHVLGNPGAPMTLVEYGSYVCQYCHAAHQVIAHLRDRFGDRMRYVFRHLPLTDRDQALRAAELAEYAAATGSEFWEVHDTLMRRGPVFADGELERIGAAFGVPPRADRDPALAQAAAVRVRDDAQGGLHAGAQVTPTFYINGRRYEGPWDESSLAEAMLGSLGHRLHAATIDFARWAPSTGVLLLLMTVLAVGLANSPFGPAVEAWWRTPLGLRFGAAGFAMPLRDWIDHGLLTAFFLVVGLEIKRELTVGRLATRRAAALPVVASLGGMVAPALLYLLVAPAALAHGWGTTITTDTAFAVALIVVLGDRVPVDLRVFLTAAVVVDDLVAIAVVALVYSGAVHAGYLAASVGVTAALVALNRSNVYRPLPYAVLGVVLWGCLHAAGLHATLAGVVLAVVTPTRPPANLNALMAQAQTIVDAETREHGETVMRHGPSEPALRALDGIHDRIESPASKLLRAIEPWSSYLVLPVFALANAGVVWSADVLQGHARLVAAVVLGLVVGKPVGIVAASWLAVRSGLAMKPTAYSWRQLGGAATMAGIGFTMSLFIAAQAFPRAGDFTAAKLAIFLASASAALLGTLLLRRAAGTAPAPTPIARGIERGTVVPAGAWEAQPPAAEATVRSARTNAPSSAHGPS